MTEKNEAEDGNSISLNSPWNLKWDIQQFLPFFLSPYSPLLSVYFSVSPLQIAGKHPVLISKIIYMRTCALCY